MSIKPLSEVLTLPERFSADREAPTCADCQDRGWIVDRGECGYSEARRCRCLLQRIAQARRERIPERYRDKALEHFRPQSDREQEVVDALKADPRRSLMLSGPVGRGKTHLLYAQYRRQLELGFVESTVVTDLDFARMARQTVAGERSGDLFSVDSLEAKPMHHVFLDDLGKARLTAFVREQLWALVNVLYSRKFGLTVTTNLSEYQLAAWMDGKGDEYLGYGESFVRRLTSLCEVFELEDL